MRTEDLLRRLAPGLALLLAACGGAGAGAAAPAEPESFTVVFHDPFDGSAEERWIPSDPDVVGEDEAGDLALGNGDVTADAPPLERGEHGLEVIVEMAWPAFCPDGAAHTSRPIQLVEADTGLVVASLVVATAADCGTLLVEYRVDPMGSVTESSVLNPVTSAPEAFADGFHEYRLVVRADGRVHWYRDGVAMITSFVPLADRTWVLRLEGLKVEGAPPVRFSEVEVRRR